jgi:UDP-N-acetylmuramyl pentapeptide phosphotransferase/UDP-N-acetylglucosamine-1-phosphate transferase/HEAT repeat protein/lysophospholipase L1-like esterase
MTSPAAASPRQSLLGNLALALAVSAAFLGVLEGFCRLVEARRPRPQVADYLWDWQRQWDGEFYTMRSDANGWPPWEEFNADGLRDRTHAREKPVGTRRLVFLGDSVTLGDQIESRHAYPQFLQGDLAEAGHAVEVFNVALWGWSTRQERLAYERIARAYAPDDVVLAVCLNDIPELQNNLTKPPRLLAALHERSALVRRIVNAPGREIGSVEELFGSPEPEKVRAAFERFFAEVRALRAAVTKDGASFAVVVFPFRFQVAAAAPPPRAQERIAAFCAAEGIRCLDLLPTLGPAGEAAFVDYDHLSPAGARLVARALRASGLVAAGPSAAEQLAASCAGACPAIAAWKAGGPAPPALPELVRLLQGPAPETRAAAAWAIARLGADARSALPALEAALRDPSEGVRVAAVAALGAVAADRAAPALFAALGDPRQAVRWEAARALSRATLDPGTAVPHLNAALRGDDAYLRGFAAWTLGEMGPRASAAVPALVEALARGEGYGRGGASTALAKMGPAARAAVPALVLGLQDADGERRWKAARTLGRIGPAAADAVPALVACLEDSHEYVRSHAARALGRIAVRSLPVDRGLAGASRDRTPAVAKEARAAALELGLLLPSEPPGARPLGAALASAVAALLLALGLTPLVAGWARRRDWLDVPDGRVRTHPRAVPRIGGIAVAAAFAGGLAAGAHPAWGVGAQGLAVLMAAAAILLVGVADDLRGVPVPIMLAVEAAAALGLVAQAGAVRAIALPGLTIPLGALALPLTALWLVAIANAFDAIDRVDGLAAGGGAAAAALLAAVALGYERTGAAVVGAALAGAFAGFYRYNRRPASIFLGDGGSLACGFVLGAVSLWAATGDGVLRPGVPVAFVVLPLLLAASRGRRPRVLAPEPVAAESGEGPSR